MYSKIDSLFWLDSKNKSLSDEEKLLFLYLLTCPHRNILGYFYLPISYAAADLKWSSERVSKGLDKLFRKGYVTLDESSEMILIRNFLKYNTFENPNQVKGAVQCLKSLPCSALDATFLELLKTSEALFCQGKSDYLLNQYDALIKAVEERVSKGFAKGFERVSKPVTVTVTVTEAEYSNTSDDVLLPRASQEQIAPTQPPVAEMPLNDGSLFPIHQEDIDKWKELYPAVDVMQEIKKMIGWLDANPSKRKTKNGIKRFINGWLAKEQDKGGKAYAGATSTTSFVPSRQG